MSAVKVECRKSERLAELETVIERGLTTFIEVGLALTEIRNQRLYQGTHGTFEAYCREQWGWSRQHANRQIRAAEVASLLEPRGSIPPTEKVTRELVPLADAPQAMRAAWTEAVERHGPEPTAAEVREVVAPRLNRQLQRDPVGTWDEQDQVRIDVMGAENKARIANENLEVLEDIAHRSGSKVATKYVLKMLTRVETRCRRIRTLLEPAT